MDPVVARSSSAAATGSGVTATTTTAGPLRDPLRHMTEAQYREQAAAATKELRRLRRELATLRGELEMAVRNHNAAATDVAMSMSFNQNIHLDRDVEERVNMYWDFRPQTGFVHNQRFAVMSIVAPEGTNQRAESFGIKIFGCFSTLEDANAYARDLQNECNAFDYYTVETQSWAKLPPRVDKLDDQHFQEEELEKLKRSVVGMRQARAKMLEERILADKADAKTRKQGLLTDTDAPADGGVAEAKTES